MKTGRPRKLDIEGEGHIRLRVEIAKSSHVFSQKELAQGFDLSMMTLRRYYIPKERRASQILASKKYEEKRLVDTSICFDCKAPVFGHDRCVDCSILLHESPVPCHCGVMHGEKNGKRCFNCFDRYYPNRVGI